MNDRYRDRSEEQRNQEGGAPPAGAGAAGGAGSGGDEVRARARRLLDVGDDLIRRALSGDSERFLAQNRQQGGQ
jgi:hypothetical protein